MSKYYRPARLRLTRTQEFPGNEALLPEAAEQGLGPLYSIDMNNRPHNQTTHSRTEPNNYIKKPPAARCLLSLIGVMGVMVLFSTFPGNAAQTGDGATTVRQETSAAAEKVGTAAANAAKDLWARIDEARLKNRTPDELAAWVIMGLMVGAVAGMGTTLKPTGLGKLGRVLLGLTGAFVGGIIVHITEFDFGWGPVLIRYEELFFSLLGAILIVVTGRLIAARMKEARKPR